MPFRFPENRTVAGAKLARLIKSEFNWIRQALFLSSQTDPGENAGDNRRTTRAEFVGAVKKKARARSTYIHTLAPLSGKSF